MGTFRGVSQIEKHCKAYDFVVGKMVSCAKTSGLILTVCTSYEMITWKDVPLGGVIDTAAHLCYEIPKKNLFWDVNRHFQAKCANY